MASRLFHALVVAGSSLAATSIAVGGVSAFAGCGTRDTPVYDAVFWHDIGVAWPEISAALDLSVQDQQRFWTDIGVPSWPDIGVPIDLMTPDLSTPDLRVVDFSSWPDIGVPLDYSVPRG